MSLTIQDLLQQKIFSGVTLAAGANGIRSKILWVNIMEIPDSPSSVQPGELLLTTGYGLDQEELYQSFIPELARRGVSGIAIQAGYYINNIPAYILNQADALDFPVLLVPKELTFSEFLHTMIRMLDPKTKLDWSGEILEQVFSLLSADLTKASATAEAEAEGEESCVQILLMEPINYAQSEQATWQKCLAEITSFIQANSLYTSMHQLPEHRWFCLTSYPSLSSFLSTFYRLNIRFALLSEEYGVNYYLGAEHLRPDDNVLTAIRHAVEALTTLQMIKARRGVCFYGHIEFLKMFGQIHRRESSIVLDNRHFQQLLQYDRANRSNYLQTLRVYLSNNCNMMQTARQLFLHRHTLINRLEKIEEISDLHLDDYYSRLYMSIALLLHDYFVY